MKLLKLSAYYRRRHKSFFGPSRQFFARYI